MINIFSSKRNFPLFTCKHVLKWYFLDNLNTEFFAHNLQKEKIFFIYIWSTAETATIMETVEKLKTYKEATQMKKYELCLLGWTKRSQYMRTKT